MTGCFLAANKIRGLTVPAAFSVQFNAKATKPGFKTGEFDRVGIFKTKRNIVLLAATVSVVGCVLLLVFFHFLGENIRREVSMAKSNTAVEAVREKFLELASPGTMGPDGID